MINYSLNLKLILYVVLIVLNFNTIVGQEKSVRMGNQQWFHYYNQTQLSNNWFWQLDTGFRFKENFDENSQFIIRTAVDHSINKRVSLSSGIAYSTFYRENDVYRIELRPYQDLNFKGKLGFLEVNNRFRIEKRLFKQLNDSEIQNIDNLNFRLRYLIVFTIPLIRSSKGNMDTIFSLNIGKELFLNTQNSNVFDQNRLLVSPTIKIDKNKSLSLTWNNQISNFKSTKQFNYTSIYWIQFRHKIDVRKK